MRDAPSPRLQDSGQRMEQILAISPVIPVVVLGDADDAVPVAQALVRGGVRVIEVTLRTRAALDGVRAITAEVPDILVGVGTIRTPEDVEAACRSGAEFLVLPGSPPRLLSAALESGAPVLPGAATLTEMMALAERGIEAMKFFPAEPAGGASYLSAVAGPLPDLRFCPTGGISPESAPSYLRLPGVPCVGGSWITPASAFVTKDWTRVESLARAAVTVLAGPFA